MGKYVVTFSPTGTTTKVSKNIAKGIGGEFIHYDLTLESGRLETLKFEDDTVVIGMPVYAGRIPLVMEDFLKTMESRNTKAIPVVVYGNRAYEDALLELSDLCESSGMEVVAAGAFIGEHSYTKDVATGRPDKEDIFKAIDFGEHIDVNKHLEKIPGHHPYRERQTSLPIAPDCNAGCINCRKCIDVCPMSVINQELKADEKKCIRCFSCVRTCPVGARDFDSRIDHVKVWLKENYSERREPEVFL